MSIGHYIMLPLYNLLVICHYLMFLCNPSLNALSLILYNSKLITDKLISIVQVKPTSFGDI